MKTDTIYYVYPQHHDVSFRYVAQQYIKMLRESLDGKYKLYEIPELNYYMFTPVRYPLSIVHPFFYSMYHWSKVEFSFFEQYRSRLSALIGVEVADSDQISQEYINLANDYAHEFVVNSTWSRNTFEKSGLKIPINIVYHAYDPLLESEVDFSKVDKEIQLIRRVKEEKKIKLMMISLWHSDYRKGADLFHEVARKIQKERNDVYFLVKSALPRTDFSDLRMFNVTGIIPFYDMVALYKVSDVYLLPSRGGSFELNCLEALIAGIPCIATEGGAWGEFFNDYTRHLLVRARDHPVVLPGNKIHMGRGVEMDVEEAVNKLFAILDNLDEEKEKVKMSHDYLREKFSYGAVKKQLMTVIEKYLM